MHVFSFLIMKLEGGEQFLGQQQTLYYLSFSAQFLRCVLNSSNALIRALEKRIRLYRVDSKEKENFQILDTWKTDNL